MKRATMRDVAEYAGVSKSTVSHVINETRFVEEGTKQRVLQAINVLGYRPSRAARSLTTQSSGIVGVVVSDMNNIFFGEVIRGIEDTLREEDYSFIVSNTNETLERESQALDMLLRQRVDGIIAAATSHNWDILTEVEKLHMPIVLLDRTFENANWPFVGVNNEQGAYLGMQHIIESGHKKIGILAGLQRLTTMRKRLAGAKRALYEANLEVNDNWVISTDLEVDAARAGAFELMTMAERPTALFMNNNLLSLGTLTALQDLGLHCPTDIALVGFDDHPWAAVANPPLTVVRQPTEALGRAAAAVILDMISGDGSRSDSVVLECELIVRDSC